MNEYPPSEIGRMVVWRQFIEPLVVSTLCLTLAKALSGNALMIPTTLLFVVSVVVGGRIARQRTEGVPYVTRWWVPLLALVATGILCGMTWHERPALASILGMLPMPTWYALCIRTDLED